MTKLLFEHVVVLMLENRSFDHLFGYLGIGEGLTGVSATNYRKPLNKKTTAFNAQRGGDYTAIGQGPAHSLKEVNMQLFAATNLPASMPRRPGNAERIRRIVRDVAQDRSQARADRQRAAASDELLRSDPVAGALNAGAELRALRSLVCRRAGADDAEPRLRPRGDVARLYVECQLEAAIHLQDPVRSYQRQSVAFMARVRITTATTSSSCTRRFPRHPPTTRCSRAIS